MDILDLSGIKIRELRDDLNWTREFLSEKSGVPARTIQDIETGVSKNPGIETMKSLLKALPNYIPSQIHKAQLILKIQASLPALDDDELRTILASVEDFARMRTRSGSATGAD